MQIIRFFSFEHVVKYDRDISSFNSWMKHKQGLMNRGQTRNCTKRQCAKHDKANILKLQQVCKNSSYIFVVLCIISNL